MDHTGVWSILPIVVAIACAVVTRQVILALFLGVYVGVLTIEGGHPLAALTSLIRDYLFMNTCPFTDPHERIIHLPKNVSLTYKTAFIDTCNAMLHARRQGGDLRPCHRRSPSRTLAGCRRRSAQINAVRGRRRRHICHR